VLRGHLKRAPLPTQVGRLYDSVAIAHAECWDLPLPDLEQTLACPAPSLGDADCAPIGEGLHA